MVAGPSDRTSASTGRASSTSKTQCGASDGTTFTAWPFPAHDRYAQMNNQHCANRLTHCRLPSRPLLPSIFFNSRRCRLPSRPRSRWNLRRRSKRLRQPDCFSKQDNRMDWKRAAGRDRLCHLYWRLGASRQRRGPPTYGGAGDRAQRVHGAKDVRGLWQA